MGTLSVSYDYDSNYTIEFNGSKGWEVIRILHSLTDAVNCFRDYVANNDGQYRLTTPK